MIESDEDRSENDATRTPQLRQIAVELSNIEEACFRTTRAGYATFSSVPDWSNVPPQSCRMDRVRERDGAQWSTLNNNGETCKKEGHKGANISGNGRILWDATDDCFNLRRRGLQ
ncbi:unnamed protein product, partial [Iphiclides podalirius]